MLENGQINSHRNQNKSNMSTSPKPGVYELKDIGITKNIIRAIK